MGYILPVRPHQYDAYQERMRMNKQDPMRIDKSFPVLLATQYRDIANEYSDPASDYIDLDEGMTKRVMRQENMYAVLTGKGRRFNHFV